MIQLPFFLRLALTFAILGLVCLGGSLTIEGVRTSKIFERMGLILVLLFIGITLVGIWTLKVL